MPYYSEIPPHNVDKAFEKENILHYSPFNITGKTFLWSHLHSSSSRFTWNVIKQFPGSKVGISGNLLKTLW